MSNERFAFWIYGVVEAGVAGPPRCLGVDDQCVELVRVDGVGALVSRVPRPHFDAPVLCRSLQQRRSFEALLHAHQGALREALALGPVVPFGFATVLPTEAALRALLRRERPRLTGALARLRGKSEWSLKAYAAEHGSGELVNGLHERLAATTTGATRLPVAERGLALHAAYLVTEAEANVFATLVWTLARDHGEDGIALELTGPWPAFHFSEAPAA